MNDIVSLCKRRGFVFQSSEVYGGINSCWDYGPLGVELKHNVKNLWWKTMTLRGDVEGLDASILMHPKVWEASGHVANFTDPLVECASCRSRFRQDQVQSDKCPKCEGKLGEPRMFNLMFKTHMGPVEDAGALVYLRPETAQGIYVNFQNVQVTQRRKLPFGIAQIGKAFRNEITPGNFIFRTREFEQMEMQYFVRPGSDDKWMDYWKNLRMEYYLKLGVRKEKLGFHTHGDGELAHYAKSAFDIQYEFPFGWQEIEGIHNRSDFDLKNHSQFSGKSLQYFDEEIKEKYTPYIIETSAGCDRTLLMFLVDAYRAEVVSGDDGKTETRVVLGFHPDLAPVKLAILPLMKKDGLGDYADKLFEKMKWSFKTDYDAAGSIGKRYRRQDEVGTPFCVTVDYDTLKDNTVTVRHRDSMKQERVSTDALESYLRNNWGK